MVTKQTFHLRPDGEKAFGYAQAVKVDNTLHLAGALSVNDAFEPQHPGDMSAQVADVYESVGRTLREFGASLADVVKETIYVTDMDAFLAANALRIHAYAGHLPATTVVQVQRLAFPECLVEIEVTAVI